MPKLGISRASGTNRTLNTHKSFHWRLILIIAFFSLVLGAVAVRVFSLAIVEHRRFVLAAERQQQVLQTLPSTRGSIFMQDKLSNLQPLAAEKTFYTAVAAPKNIVEPQKAAKILSEILAIPEAELLNKLAKSSDPYEVIAKKISDEAAAKITNLKVKGFDVVEEGRRVYPHGALAAALVGFVSYKDGDEKGEYGLEKQYEDRLKGERGFFAGEKDTSGYWVALGRRILNPPVNGDNLVLTVDPNIQFKVEEELSALIKKWQGESALAIVMEPKTGRILALASRPTFDPNEYSREKDFSVFRMPAVDSQFELGSVFKPITLSAGINAGAVMATTTYSDPGTVAINGFRISNFDGQSHGVQTMTQVLEKSLNTGAMFVEQKLGKEKFLEFLKKFGFGIRTGIDFPGELSGNISNLDAKKDIDYATASFGQGIAVTPIQMAAAIGAIANKGVAMKPYLVEKTIDANGNETLFRPQEVRRVISTETSEVLSKMLVSTVRAGFENRAGVKGYFIAGKTGTAQIPLKGRRGYSEDVIHTFVGYAPAFDPRFLALFEIVRPQGNRFAANTLTPAFHNIAEFILNYYEIPPDEK